MKKLTLLLIIILNSIIAASQWQEYPVFTSAQLWEIQFVSENSGWILGTHSSSNQQVLYRTIDGGLTWDSTLFNHYLSNFCFINEYEGFAIAGYSAPTDSLLKTFDGGITWTGSPLPNNYGTAEILFLDQDTGWIGGYLSGLFRTYDGGINWTDLSGGLPTSIGTMDFINSDIGYFTGSEEGENFMFCNSPDGGQTWNTLLNMSFMDFIMFHNQSGYGINISGSVMTGFTSAMYKTQDDGNSWIEILTPNPAFEYFVAIDFINEEEGWISIWNTVPGFNGDGRIYYTSDGGATWAQQFNQGVTDFEIINHNKVWAIQTMTNEGPSKIFYTENAGVGIAESKLHQNKLIITPNPSSGFTTISIELARNEEASLTICNINGEIIEQRFLAMKKTGNFDLNCSEYPSGIYLVTLKSKSGAMTRKLIIE